MTAGDVSASASIINAQGLQRCVAGQDCSVLLSTCDMYTNPVSHGGAVVTASLRGVNAVPVRVQDNCDGSYIIAYAAEIVGEYELDVFVNSQPIYGTPFYVNVESSATCVRRCELINVPSTPITAGERVSVILIARDAYGNKRPCGGDNVIASLIGTMTVPTSVIDHNDGSYELQFCINKCGTYTINMSVNSEDISPSSPSSQSLIHIIPASVCGRHCDARGSGLSRGSVIGCAASFIITARDEFDNVVQHGGECFDVSIEGPSSITAIVDDNRDGTYTVTYTVAAAGEYIIGVTHNSEHIHGSPFSVYASQNIDAYAVRLVEQKAAPQLRQYRRTMRNANDELAQLRADVMTMNNSVVPLVTTIQEGLFTAMKAQQQAVEDANTRYRHELRERRRLHNALMELRGNIRVFCRVRPLLPTETSNECTVTFPTTYNVFIPKRASITQSDKVCCAGSFAYDSLLSQTFEFDRVFDPTSTQNDVFDEIRPLVTSVLDGYNVCVFAYGQTGSGKTYTMEGTLAQPGLTFQTLSELYHVMNEERADSFVHTLSISVLEIYNERIRDLLADAAFADSLEVIHTSRGMSVKSLTRVDATTLDQLTSIMRAGLDNRSIGVTNVNEHSSRSHCIVTVYVESTNLVTNIRRYGKLHLIDLAGSERVGKSGATGERLVEATHINKSLSCLGNVISALLVKYVALSMETTLNFAGKLMSHIEIAN